MFNISIIILALIVLYFGNQQVKILKASDDNSKAAKTAENKVVIYGAFLTFGIPIIITFFK